MASEERVFILVKRVIGEVLPDLDQALIASNKSLLELGANSVDRVEVVTTSMERLDLTVPLSKFANVNNIGELVSVLCKELSSLTLSTGS
jgi:polyketide biosynthesis acyl carrier protein